MSQVKGVPQLRARMRAIKQTFKPVGRSWADTTAELARPHVPVRTGKGRASVRRKNASMKRASVAAIYYVGILDKGAVAHDITPRKKPALVFKGRSGTVFSKKVRHPGQRGKQFARRASQDSLRKHPMAVELIRLWNQAA